MYRYSTRVGILILLYFFYMTMLPIPGYTEIAIPVQGRGLYDAVPVFAVQPCAIDVYGIIRAVNKSYKRSYHGIACMFQRGSSSSSSSSSRVIATTTDGARCTASFLRNKQGSNLFLLSLATAIRQWVLKQLGQPPHCALHFIGHTSPWAHRRQVHLPPKAMVVGLDVAVPVVASTSSAVDQWL